MTYELSIYRQKNKDAPGGYRTYALETDDEGMTVAKALLVLNERHPDDEIRWEHSCLQRKCGACAMVVNGVPSLACAAVLRNVARHGRVVVGPLRKFPIVADLIVDRSVVFRNLETLRVWAEGDVALADREVDAAYEASRCLQCGLCLEVCPNFFVGGAFFGMASMVPASRLLVGQPDRRDLQEGYRKHVFAGCGKSLACRNVCPAHIDLERLMSRSNGVAVWRRLAKGRKA